MAMNAGNGNRKGGVFSRLWFRARPDKDPSHRHLLERDRFKRAVDFERARAERSDSAFILVRIRLISDRDGKNGHDAAFAHLAAVVGERIRFTDVAGMSGDGIGMIFPNTPLEAIESIVQNIDALFRRGDAAQIGCQDKLPEIACDIYSSEIERDADVSDRQQEELWPQLRT